MAQEMRGAATKRDTLRGDEPPCEPGAAEMVTAPYVPPIGQDERIDRLVRLGYTEAAYDPARDFVQAGSYLLPRDSADRLIRFCEASGLSADFPPVRDLANLAGSAEEGDKRSADDIFREWAHRCLAGEPRG